MIYCLQSHQIDLCATCTRRRQLIPSTSIENVSIYVPKLMPVPTCNGYKKEEYANTNDNNKPEVMAN